MKLELKHLAGYLPYGLKLERINYKNERFKQLTAYDLCPDGEIENIKPILRPLSDLTKEIEVNGINMNPLVNLKIQGYNLNFDDDFTFEDFINGNFLNNSYGFIQLLLCWHFDIYGLIEKGLAIDINTINK